MKKEFGFKFLGGNLKCGYLEEVYYPAPQRKADGTWTPGEWLVHPKPDRVSYGACGIGYHLMKSPNPKYVRFTGNGYLAEGRELLGEDEEKVRYASVRLLRPLAKHEIFYPGAYLVGADLRGADLVGADLVGADLRGADLRGAHLVGADLRGADLVGAHLVGADLRGADLVGADLVGADLVGADLRGANLDNMIGHTEEES